MHYISQVAIAIIGLLMAAKASWEMYSPCSSYVMGSLFSVLHSSTLKFSVHSNQIQWMSITLHGNWESAVNGRRKEETKSEAPQKWGGWKNQEGWCFCHFSWSKWCPMSLYYVLMLSLVLMYLWCEYMLWFILTCFCCEGNTHQEMTI